jgi:hypothetical protein
VGTKLGHGFHPLKARHRSSIPNLFSVHPQGRTLPQAAPIGLHICIRPFCSRPP